MNSLSTNVTSDNVIIYYNLEEWDRRNLPLVFSYYCKENDIPANLTVEQLRRVCEDFALRNSLVADTTYNNGNHYVYFQPWTVPCDTSQ